MRSRPTALALMSIVTAAAADSPMGWAVVTGASSGIGTCLAREAAAQGHDVVLTSRSERRLKTLAAELSSTYPVQTMVVPCDLSDPDGPSKLHHKTSALDVTLLVANAGEAFSGRFDSQPIDSVERILQLNVCGTTRLCHLFAASMKAAPSSSRNRKRNILLTGSVTACPLGLPGGCLYAASKAMQRSLSAGLRAELRPHGVSVTCLLPGATATQFAQTAGMEGSLVFSMPFARTLGVVSDPQVVARRGLAAARAGRAECVPGALNKAFALLAKVAPAPVARRVGSAFYSA